MANSFRRRLVRSVLRPEMKAKWPLHKKRKPMLQKRKPMPPTAEEIARRERRAARIQEFETGPMRTVPWPFVSSDDPDNPSHLRVRGALSGAGAAVQIRGESSTRRWRWSHSVKSEASGSR